MSRVATLANADTESLSFFANPAYRDALRKTAAAAVIVSEDDAGDCPVAALVAHDAYLTYARMAGVLHPVMKHTGGVHESAIVDSGARIADSAHIAARVTIGADCFVGDDAYIGPGCIIGPGCRAVGVHMS